MSRVGPIMQEIAKLLKATQDAVGKTGSGI